MMISRGEWVGYIRSDHFFAKTIADEVSKVWDRLINVFTANVLAGTSVAVLGEEPSVSLSERGLRFMAMENHFARRLLGAAVANALQTARELRQDRFARVIMPSAVSANPKVAYVIMILAYPIDLEERGGLEGGYAYLTGPRFRHRIDAIVEKFTDMEADLDRERKTMMRLWAKREEQLRGVLDSTVGLYGDLQGIAGRAMQEIESLDVLMIEVKGEATE
jgi:hypothetical protein